MTFVVARRFGDRLIVYSDTMISNRGANRRDIIPGALKSVVVHRHVSVAFAGSAPIAMDAVRQARDGLARGEHLNAVVEGLRLCSAQHAGDEQACDFIVTSHISGPAMYRIRDGECIAPTGQCWIGNPAPLDTIARAEDELIRGLRERGKEAEPNESTFSHAVSSLALTPAAHASLSIGGFIFNQLGSPWGHTYQPGAAASFWDSINLATGVTPQQTADRLSGMSEYRYSIVNPGRRGVAVVGAFLEQAQTGYVYSPFTLDAPMLIRATSASAVAEEVSSLAEAQGGFLEEMRADGTV